MKKKEILMRLNKLESRMNELQLQVKMSKEEVVVFDKQYLWVKPAAALYGFIGWLTSRKIPVIMSSSNNAAIPAELVDLYCKENSFEDKNIAEEIEMLKHPKE